VVGDTTIAHIYDNGPYDLNNILVLPNPTSTANFTEFQRFEWNSLQECGDHNGPNIWMHPSNAYIFFYDLSQNAVPIEYISTVKGELEESRAGLQSMPGNPSTILSVQMGDWCTRLKVRKCSFTFSIRSREC
jgi:hypothetical protein